MVLFYRYDARLLLDSLPLPHTRRSSPEPSSPGGWSDLPSDSEDTFFFSPQEAEDYHREKRRRVIERSREERLKALREEDGPQDPPEEIWGGSDEEPDQDQKGLMRRTATHILSSPNPAQLEMRILANYGGDRRFAFLRGRWSRAWQLIKGRARIDMTEKTKSSEKPAGLGGLAAYGDSDGDSSGSDANAEDVTVPLATAVTDAPDVTAEEAVKAARRARAKEWAEKRRANKDGDE